ncbi:crossover junction endodeoxyribonuclease RuvC [Persephonella atlantica]|uniref:Crossover junction endodeoxyribonuclease RuvC n=1 Tax=Persephonella atlantica TaxID=2699429 RepID=A0ABS1GJN7_9AQUI|nr:crossover junction endodeoxyribonuclease RuvC [Persephonella atlantica]MBK3333143.1 crossover junction endodeoxyribonuclease RuvC [Persephonella atlantica]
MKVLGIDPGNYCTGYSILEGRGNRYRVITYGSIKSRKRPENLGRIFSGLQEVIQVFSPEEIALESAFYGKNPQSLLRLGEVRGVVLLLSSINSIPLYEYTPQKVKNSITGYGWSGKNEVLMMVEKLLNVKPENHDEADAIAVAFCHLLSRRISVE